MNWTPFITLLKYEINRFLSMWGQSLLAPITSVLLYMIIFGVSIGQQIHLESEHSYLEFIIPGLMMIGIMSNSVMNGSFSLFLGKMHGSIFDLLVAPIRAVEMALAYIIASVLRGLMIGAMIYAIGYGFSGLVPLHPLIIGAVSVLTAWSFAAIGLIIAVWAKTFDQLGIFNSFIMTPLIFLGGVFYSLDMLPPFWQTVARANPMLYMIDSLRYGFLGTSDMNPYSSILFLFILSIASTALLTWIFKSGWKLRT
ncbi:ABC transporter permease [Candidatus Peregrinibacteria bacterium]|nr:MAG: ABC transporter permease [Candidatus Peregrinibacteria bacterium]